MWGYVQRELEGKKKKKKRRPIVDALAGDVKPAPEQAPPTTGEGGEGTTGTSGAAGVGPAKPIGQYGSFLWLLVPWLVCRGRADSAGEEAKETATTTSTSP